MQSTQSGRNPIHINPHPRAAHKISLSLLLPHPRVGHQSSHAGCGILRWCKWKEERTHHLSSQTQTHTHTHTQSSKLYRSTALSSRYVQSPTQLIPLLLRGQLLLPATVLDRRRPRAFGLGHARQASSHL